MENIIPLLLAGVTGFTHAFEVDHLLAVSSIVTRRNSTAKALKDGIFWGLGHTSTIMIIGICMILVKFMITENTFHYFEACVGLMLIVLGGQRIWKNRQYEQEHAAHHHHEEPDGHGLAYSVGLVHGLAGSGSLVLLVMANMHSAFEGIVYLLIFGAGSVAGMLVASGVFSMPFSARWSARPSLHQGLALLSSLLCIGFGCKVVYENLTGI